jgi:hypothetical protein
LWLATTNGGTAVRTWELSASQTNNRNLVIRDIDAGLDALVVQPGTGHVGIGIAGGGQPQEMLHVFGTVLATGFVANGSGANITGPVVIQDPSPTVHYGVTINNYGGVNITGHDGLSVTNRATVGDLLTASGGISAVGSVTIADGPGGTVHGGLNVTGQDGLYVTSASRVVGLTNADGGLR